MNEELVEAARAGNLAQIERLVEAVWADAYKLSRAILGYCPGAEDAAQEACVILYRTIATLRNAAAFRAWFYRIVVREALAIKRRQSKVEPESVRDPLVEDRADSIDIWRALETLPDRLREVVVLRYFEDLTSREIASVLRVPDGTVRFRLMMARRRLRPLLGDISNDAARANGEVRTNAI